MLYLFELLIMYMLQSFRIVLSCCGEHLLLDRTAGGIEVQRVHCCVQVLSFLPQADSQKEAFFIFTS